MTGPTGPNPEFELRGVHHLALVCRDMARTVDFYTGVLGMPLVKTIELPCIHQTVSAVNVVPPRVKFLSVTRRTESRLSPVRLICVPALPWLGENATFPGGALMPDVRLNMVDVVAGGLVGFSTRRLYRPEAAMSEG